MGKKEIENADLQKILRAARNSAICAGICGAGAVVTLAAALAEGFREQYSSSSLFGILALVNVIFLKVNMDNALNKFRYADIIRKRYVKTK